MLSAANSIRMKTKKARTVNRWRKRKSPKRMI